MLTAYIFSFLDLHDVPRTPLFQALFSIWFIMKALALSLYCEFQGTMSEESQDGVEV